MTMNADHVIHALNGRRISEDRFVFECPSHESKSGNSGRGRVLNDRILLKDFGGCSTANILAAAGLTWSDLFANSRPVAQPERQRTNEQRQAVEGLKVWRDGYLDELGKNLRTRDELRLAVSQMVADGLMTEEAAYPY